MALPNLKNDVVLGWHKCKRQ
ncbi:uncharacterized protein G2W53_044470 [Senna tora]|uniref:Uncharacterized protein n=1 Tax=Senna tora TaxID=362788 RepID=A0A834SDN0_9FABA|nr:uncharacterized protein G2W53_044470 [Senna tora]